MPNTDKLNNGMCEARMENGSALRMLCLHSECVEWSTFVGRNSKCGQQERTWILLPKRDISRIKEIGSSRSPIFAWITTHRPSTTRFSISTGRWNIFGNQRIDWRLGGTPTFYGAAKDGQENSYFGLIGCQEDACQARQHPARDKRSAFE